MPTFKHYKFKGKFHLKRNDFQIEKAYDLSLQEDGCFYEKVNKTLNTHNILLIIKYHSSQDMRYVLTKETTNIKIISDGFLSDSGVSLYSLLGAADALITDFSSVCYDYMLIDKPIGFDVTDLELYVKGGSSWVEDPLIYMPGEKIYSVDDFCKFIASVADGDDGFVSSRKELTDKIHVYQDNQSAKRVVDLISK
jgi:CDP-glycerol glycerophosphotransferase (TagB/SpsB family)